MHNQRADRERMKSLTVSKGQLFVQAALCQWATRVAESSIALPLTLDHEEMSQAGNLPV